MVAHNCTSPPRFAVVFTLQLVYLAASGRALPHFIQSIVTLHRSVMPQLFHSSFSEPSVSLAPATDHANSLQRAFYPGPKHLVARGMVHPLV